MKLAAEILAMLLKLVILVALVILTFGYSYSFLLLDIYGGMNLTSEDGKIFISHNLYNNSVCRRTLVAAYILYVCIVSCCEWCYRGIYICHDEPRTD